MRQCPGGWGRQRACVHAGPPVFYTPVHDGAEQMMKPDSALFNLSRTCARLACWRVAFVLVSTASVKHMHGRVTYGKVAASQMRTLSASGCMRGLCAQRDIS